MFEIVFRHDDYGTFGAQPSIDQGLGNRLRALPGLGITDVSPIAQTAVCVFDPLGQHSYVWFACRPMHQAIGHPGGEVFQRLVGRHVAHTTGALAHVHAGHAKLQGSEFGSAHGFYFLGGFGNFGCLTF